MITRYWDMAYFNSLVADMTYDINPWCYIDLEKQK